MSNRLDQLFQVSASRSSFRLEVIGGITTFMAMSYIIAVQPAMLQNAGMDFGAVMVATCLSSCLATLIMAFWANYPIGIAPAMGHNAYFTFAVVLASQGRISWQVALAGVFVAGMIFALISRWGVRERIIEVIPPSLQHAIAVGIGLLITVIGLEWSGIVVPSSATYVQLGRLSSPPVLLSIGGVLLIAVLMAREFKGAILIGMLVMCAVAALTGLIRFQGIVAMPPSIEPTFLKLDLAGVLSPGMIEVVFVFLLLALFDTVGTLVGVATEAGLMVDGKLPRARQAFLADALGTAAGALLGTSTVTSYIESATGVSSGARTGLASLVTALLFLAALFFHPLVSAIGGGISWQQTVAGRTESLHLYPVAAPALIIVGSLMVKSVSRILWTDLTEAVPAFLTLIIMPLTFSITDGIAFGFIAHAALKAASGKGREVHWGMYLLAAVLLARYIWLS
ncbi:MAG: NCS2 family permease [bacterium]